MELPMLSRKRPLFGGYEEASALYSKKCLASLRTLLDRYQSYKLNEDRQKQSRCRPCALEAHVHVSAGRVADTKSFIERASSWADTELSAKRVLEHLRLRRAPGDALLDESVNRKFLEFRSDISEECGADDRQHSWAVIEKQEEVVMYGPYYPNYNSGKHSEDIIIKQTQELLESEAVAGEWKVYVFTVNSPCLSRDPDPCMLNLVRKAQEWWSAYGVKTHIGFVRCWGFKGSKENLFRGVDFKQVDLIERSADYESYIKAGEKALSESVYYVVKKLLTTTNVCIPLTSLAQAQSWNTYFKSMSSVCEGKAEEESKALTQEAAAMTEAAKSLLSGDACGVVDLLERGRGFALRHPLSPELPDASREQMRISFRQCWTEMVQEKYAAIVREKLTEDFNRCTVQLFIKDVARATKEYLQIGRIRF